MTDSLKFGPEWLRNLAGDGCSAGGGGGGSLTTPRYQLAEHRYGREEMLALFDRTCKPPELLTGFSALFVPKVQLPLALIQMTEDETCLWNGGVSAGAGRGRGGSVDRGGRNRTGRTGAHYRGVGFEEMGEVPRIETQPFPARTRAFDRPPTERTWSERNGAESVEWNGSTSPRKDLSRGLSGSSLMESNWRRHRGGGEDDDGWRMNARGEKWVKGSWRDAEKERGEKIEGDDEKRRDRWEHKGNNRAFDSHPPPLRRNRSNHHDNHDNLPEWATENPSESGGSFDASGAFHGMYSDDDDDHPDRVYHEKKQRVARVRRVSEGNATQYKNGGIKSGSTVSRSSKIDRSFNDERPKSLHGESKDQNLLPEKETRRSLSPIKLMPISNTPPIKKTPPTTNNNTSQIISSSQSTPNSIDSRKKDKGTKQAVQEKPQKEPSQTAVSHGSVSKAKSKTECPMKVEDIKSKTERNKASKTENNNKIELQQHVEQGKIKSSSIPQQQHLHQQQQQQQHLHQQQQQQQQLHQQQKIPQIVPEEVPVSIIHQQQTDDKHRSEADNLDRMEEEVAKLIDSGSPRDEKPSSVLSSSGVVVNQTVIEPSATTVSPSASTIQEKWYYRDPQGEVQGPFLASEMAEWHKQGYFTPNLLLRRTCDERYTTLGDLVNLCGRVPFKPGTSFPPLKLSDVRMSPGVGGAVQNTLPVASGLPKPTTIDDPMLLYQYQQYRLLQNQQMFLKQLRASAIGKLSQSDQWANLTSVEQNQLVLQYVRSIESEMPDIPQPPPPVVPSTFIPTISQPAPPSSSVLQMFPQLHQPTKTQPEPTHVPAPSPHLSSGPIDPIQQLMQQMSGMRNLPPMPQPTITPSPPQPQPQAPPPPQDDNPIKSWLRQLAVTSGGHVQQQPQPQLQPQIESVWHQPPPHLTSFNAQNWMSQVGAIQPTLPPGQMPGSLWDIHPKEMKTEQQILEEQNLKMQEEKKKEELRKKEELERQQAEQERLKRQQEEELARLKAAEEVEKREEVERKKRDEEKRRREEEKRKQEGEQRKLEEKRRKEEERRREEKRKQDEELNRKKQEEEKKKREEAKRQEEKLKREEEKRKKLEEEQKKQEEERLRKEEEARKKAEAEEQARKAEQRRREAEALRKLQERSKAPWAQAPPAPPPTAQASLAEIQRLEREKKAEELRIQQLLQQQQLAQQKAAEAAQEALTDSAKRLQFKWAEKAAPINNMNQVKSLVQIQQEEQEKVAKVKHQERERHEKEKANHKEATITLQNVSIWGAASQSLNWSSTTNSNNQMYGAGGGFWDDLTPKVNVTAPKTTITASSKTTVKQQTTAVKSPSQQQVQQQQNNKMPKNKNKKEEELVKKLFEQNTAKTDDFTQWCNKALTGLQVSVDIPTFIGFLRDIEAAYEVKEYVRMYLGDGKQCSEFAKQFLEKRSKWKSAQRPQTQADDLCKPAPAVNPNTSTEFQEVKSKSKKPKKGKMFKVDSKMLGFSVMSAPDRINVGDRDYAEGV